jgi:hypothetical protein
MTDKRRTKKAREISYLRSMFPGMNCNKRFYKEGNNSCAAYREAMLPFTYGKAKKSLKWELMVKR